MENLKIRDEVAKSAKNFGVHLRELRKERQFTQQDVALKLRVPISTYANWEQGRREPSLYDLYNIMFVFKIDANILFEAD